MARYEIRKFKEIKRTKKWKGGIGTFWGVWDTKNNNWVINTTGIGKEKAAKILKALEKNDNVNNPITFWRE